MFGPFTHPRPRRWGQKVKIFFLFLREFCCISSLREQSIGQHLSKTYVLTHTLKLVKMVKQSESSRHVVYQLKGLEHRAQCKHIFCPYTHPRFLRLVQTVITFFFLKIVMLHIKLKRWSIEQHASTYLFLHTPSTPEVWSTGQTFLLKVVMLHIIKGNGA